MPQICNLIKYKPGTLEFAPCGPYNQLCYLAHCHRCTTKILHFSRFQQHGRGEVLQQSAILSVILRSGMAFFIDEYGILQCVAIL